MIRNKAYEHGNGCTCGLYKTCQCVDKIETIYDESGFIVGYADSYRPVAKGTISQNNFMPTGNITESNKDSDDYKQAVFGYGKNTDLFPKKQDSEKISYKYNEDKIISDFKSYIDKTYSGHYKTEDQSVECFDAWLAMGDATPTLRNTALKYLWRY